MSIEASFVYTLSLPEASALYEYYMGYEEPEMDPFVSAMAYYPYIYGERFVSYAVERYGIEYLDTIFENLPESTEQIMHPEKYYNSEHPFVVPDPHVPSGMTVVEENTLGEGMLLMIMNQHVPYDTAETACEGWGGDHYGYYESEDAFVFAYDAIWDSAEDAGEWYSAFCQYILSATGTAIPPDSHEAWIRDKTKTIYMRHAGDITLLLIGSEEDVLRTILE